MAAAVQKSGIKLSQLFPALGISRPTLYRRFEDPNLSFDFIKRIGEIIHYDFGQDFKELVSNVAMEPVVAYQIDSLDDCKNKLLHVYGLYAELVERYNKLLDDRSKA